VITEVVWLLVVFGIKIVINAPKRKISYVSDPLQLVISILISF
jgi:hypothetical protein